MSDELKIATAEMKRLNPEASVTYFPMEQKFMGFNERHLSVTEFYDTRLEATVATVKALEIS